jgi:hypothetical protein
VRAASVSPLVGSIIYCGVISTAMARADWERAGRWVELFNEWCRNHGHALSGLCWLHRAEALHVRGELVEAQREGERALAALARHSPWAEGEAWRVLGEIHLSRGDTDAAEAAFLRAHEHGWSTQPGLALLELDRGNPQRALRLILQEVVEENFSARQRRGLLLAHCVIIAARAGARDEARKALTELEEKPQLWSTSALRAWVTCARGELAASENNLVDAVAYLRSAIRQWHAMGSPLPAARARCCLIDMLIVAGDLVNAEMEIFAVTSDLERAGATGMLARLRWNTLKTPALFHGLGGYPASHRAVGDCAGAVR